MQITTILINKRVILKGQLTSKTINYQNLSIQIVEKVLLKMNPHNYQIQKP
jgi:hypothetical protein